MQTLITGANRGIGAALARTCAANGHSVLGTARDGSCDFTLDVANPAAFATFAEEVETRLGETGVDLLVCNAGIYLDKGQPLQGGFPGQMWADTFAVNVTGVFLTVQALLPALRRAGGARIAIISSAMGSDQRAPGGSYIYRASKAAALNLGRNLAQDLKAEGISVGIYHPGWVRTDMGGSSADITVDQAATGLFDRFAALGPETTGCFQTWDGTPVPF
ncbi:SDR family oxidoreductase [Chachezhania sediminis]|uniref:SDR family oxidoreductase n=1 Tax=Chachezhania sediminis TaxID=2599291 RepID=UPI00131CAC63|nr:SDR family oxidoreductase [Chachezhania sediminis]